MRKVSGATSLYESSSSLEPLDLSSRRYSPIKSVTPMYAGKVVVKMGMFPRIPEPEFETFGDHRHHWQGKHDDVTQYKIKAGGEKLNE